MPQTRAEFEKELNCLLRVMQDYYNWDNQPMVHRQVHIIQKLLGSVAQVHPEWLNDLSPIEYLRHKLSR